MAKLIVASSTALVFGPDGVYSVRVCLEANEFRELFLLFLKLHVSQRPRVFSVVGIDDQYQDIISSFLE